MRPRSMSNADALSFIHPRSRSDWRSLLLSSAFTLLIAATGGGLYYSNQRQQMVRQQQWPSASAIIEDARTKLAMRVESQRGGSMLYEVEVLARYSVGAVERERWTKINEHPQALSDAQLQIYLLKKKQCIVRWSPADPEHISAEIN